MCPNTTGFCRVGKFKYFQKLEFKVKHHTNMLKISHSEEQRMAKASQGPCHTSWISGKESQEDCQAKKLWTVHNLDMTAVYPFWCCLWDWQICVWCCAWKVQVAKAMKGVCFKDWLSLVFFQRRSECKIPPGLQAPSLCFPSLFSRTGQEWSANSNCCAWLLPWSVVSIMQYLAPSIPVLFALVITVHGDSESFDFAAVLVGTCSWII